MIWKTLPFLLLISGCSLLSRPPAVAPVEVVKIIRQQTVYHPPLPSQINTLPVKWTVLTPMTMAEYLEDLQQGNAPQNAFYGLTRPGYENLSSNMAEIKRYIRQMRSIVQYYQNANAPEKLQKEGAEDES